MASITQIRSGLKTCVAAVSGLEAHATRPGQVNTPAAVISRRHGPQPATLGPADHDYVFAVTLLVSLADDTAGQDKLDAYLSPSGAGSVVAAIAADEDLGGVVEYAVVTDVEPDQLIEWAGQSYLGADIIVTVGSV